MAYEFAKKVGKSLAFGLFKILYVPYTALIYFPDIKPCKNEVENAFNHLFRLPRNPSLQKNLELID